MSGLLGHFRPSLPIGRHELAAAGIWDVERLTEPHIRSPHLEATFGPLAAEVAAKYLMEARARSGVWGEGLMGEGKSEDMGLGSGRGGGVVSGMRRAAGRRLVSALNSRVPPPHTKKTNQTPEQQAQVSPGRFRFRPAYASERAIAAIKVRPDSPAWLLAEAEATRAGLLALRQNVVLLRDPANEEHFYPRCGALCLRFF